jgi:predicted small secreted protein
MKKSEQKMKKLAILSVVTLMAGCATVDGVGQDISGAARTVQGWFR